MKQLLICFLSVLSWSPLSAQVSDDKEAIVDFQFAYTALPWANIDGGIERGFVYMDNVDLGLTADLGSFFESDVNLTTFLYILGNNGGYATGLVGDFQVASNIEAVPSWRLYEAWTEYNLWEDRLSLLFGLYDVNSEFDILQPALLFINSSFGIGAEVGQLGANGPSIFPVSSLAFRATAAVGHQVQLRLGIMDGVPGDPNDLTRNNIDLSREDGALIFVETSVYRSPKNANAASYKKVGRGHDPYELDKLSIGAWYFTSAFEEIGNANYSGGNFGAYVGYQEYIGSVALFARCGFANNRFNRLGSALSGGVVFSELNTRWEDQLGLAFSSGFSSAQYMESVDDRYSAETAIELTYAFDPFTWLHIQPDVQYIIHPDTRGDLSNALSAALMLQLSL